MTNFTL